MLVSIGRQPGGRSEPRDYTVHPAADGVTLEPDAAMPPDGRRMIWIPAVPSSGTSLVAGILSNLGVDFGEVANRQNRFRGYEMFEDLDLNFFSFNPNTPQDRLLKERTRLREYINYRFHKAPTGRLGVKTLATHWAYDYDAASLPVDVVVVDRDLEECLEADTIRFADGPNRDAKRKPATAYEHFNRASGVAACWEAKELLCTFMEPAIRWEFGAILEAPLAFIKECIEALELTPSVDQIRDAERFVNPNLRTVATVPASSLEEGPHHPDDGQVCQGGRWGAGTAAVCDLETTTAPAVYHAATEV